MFTDLWDNLTNGRVFTESIDRFISGFSVSSAVMLVLMIFMLIGIVDKFRGNKLGYGEKFDEGFLAMGPLALAVVGIVSLAPVLLLVLSPILTPVFGWFGASPAMFPSSILALDMGGYPLAMQLAGDNTAIGAYSGIIVASTMGITVCFTIPFALTMMKKQDHGILALGIMIGVIVLPVGCLVGGLAMRTTSTPLSMNELLLNTLPVAVLSLIVALGLIFFQKGTMRAFAGFGKGVTAIIIVSPAIAIFQYVTGIRFPLFDRMVEPDPVLNGVPLEVALLLVGQIAIVLTGAFSMIHFLNKRLGKFMNRLGSKIGINGEASTGLLTQLASSIPIWGVINTMNPRGKLINIAFAVSGSFVFGDSLAFTGGARPEMVFPVIATKLTGGILAVMLAVALQNTKLVKAALAEPSNETDEAGRL